ncbi:DUF1365 domain-containing protein [Aliihoeflea sp. 40Bstr573]|uniref:DUF1365 domain-containing protein n=1 Tax=Aliihoeflea sp. 40Bstr573 TaxID=2696467 RepID=UPI0020965241|nr:DUF1365 domain-containing protein [Aliihoeflea sp. 40Bstr573]MCO6388942.1 DUF1365 family protein [Aliihoeflea sp. 40Bstr573]
MIRKERITTMEANGAAPTAAASLYAGEVMHARMRPFSHRFTYRVFSLLLDLDRLPEAGRQSALFSVDRPGPVSFHQKDHTRREGETLRQMADRLLADAGLAEPPTRILLLAYPRILGYAFNPISIYFAYGADDELVALIYAVRNTFGESHTYVALVEDGELTPAGIRQERTKVFHVSPFIDMGARYHFRVLPPGNVVRLRIHETEAGTPLLSATFAGEHRELTTRDLARTLLRTPLMTWKVIAGIHYEALKLWLKGARFHKSPPPPKPASFRDAAKVLTAGE